MSSDTSPRKFEFELVIEDFKDLPGMLIASLAVITIVTGTDFNPFKFKAKQSPGMDSWFKDAKLGMFMHWYAFEEELSGVCMCILRWS